MLKVDSLDNFTNEKARQESERNRLKGNMLAFMATSMAVFPSILISTIVPDAFSVATDVAGGSCMTILYGVLPPVMAWVMQSRLSESNEVYNARDVQVNVGRVALSNVKPVLIGVGLLSCGIVMEQIGLNRWNSILDVSGQLPYMYASQRNNHSYNRLMSKKLADRKNGQVSINVGNEISMDKSWIVGEGEKESHVRSLKVSSCAKCALLEKARGKRMACTCGLLERPYVHSMIAIAAVCVCVCLFFRGSPQIGTVAPFKWEAQNKHGYLQREAYFICLSHYSNQK